MVSRPDYSQWTITVDPLVVAPGQTGKLRTRIQRASARELVANEIDVRLQLTAPFKPLIAQGAHVTLTNATADSGTIEIPVTYSSETVDGSASLPSTTTIFLRFFLDTNNPVAFVELTATIDAAALSIAGVANLTVLVPEHCPKAPRFVLYVTSSERNVENEPEFYEVALSRIDSGATNPVLWPLGRIKNLYFDEADQADVLLGCLAKFGGAREPIVEFDWDTKPGAQLWDWLNAFGVTLKRALLDQIGDQDDDATLLVLTEDPRFPWEIMAIPHSGKRKPSCRWVGDMFIMTRWLHDQPLPNDGGTVNVIGSVAPETIIDGDGQLDSDRTEMYALREYAAASRAPYSIELTDGTFSKVIDLVKGNVRNEILVDYIHIRTHGTPTELMVVQDAEGTFRLQRGSTGNQIERGGPGGRGGRGERGGDDPIALPDNVPTPTTQRRSGVSTRKLVEFDIARKAHVDFSFRSSKDVSDRTHIVGIDDVLAHFSGSGWLYSDRDHPPFIFFNACSIASPVDEDGHLPRVDQMGISWLDALARTGCAGFVAPLWMIDSIDGALASAWFFHALHAEIVADENSKRSGRPAAALRMIRRGKPSKANIVGVGTLHKVPPLVQGKLGNKTFRGQHSTLAYTMFGHPNLRFNLPDSSDFTAPLAPAE